MIHYIKVIKAMKRVNMPKKKKNSIIIKAILEEIINSYKILLSLPFLLLTGIFITFNCVCTFIAQGADITACLIIEKILEKIKAIPRIKVGNEEEEKEMIEQVKNLKK